MSQLSGFLLYCVAVEASNLLWTRHQPETKMMLEVVVLGLFLMMYPYLMFHGHEYYFSMVFLTMSVCEGALGLSLLASLVRTHGNNYFQSFNVLW